MSIQTIKIFLASSSELKEDRREFEIAMQRKNDQLVKKGIYLDVVVWEDFLDQVSKTRLQDEYNKVILQCDIFILLFFTKVGKFSFEEFQMAHESFLKTGKPEIFTYFKDAPIDSSALNEANTTSLFQFKNKLREIGHYVSMYKSTGDLKYHFSDQLSKMEIVKSDIKIVTRSESSQTNPVSAKIDTNKKKKTLLFGGIGLLSIAIIALLFILKPWSDPEPVNPLETETAEIQKAAEKKNDDAKDEIIPEAEKTKVIKENTDSAITLPEYCRIQNRGGSNNRHHYLNAIGDGKLSMGKETNSSGTKWHLVKISEYPDGNFYRLENRGGNNDRLKLLNAIGNGVLSMSSDITASGTTWELMKVTQYDGHFYQLRNRGGSNDRLKYLNAIGDGKLSMTDDTRASGITWQLIGYE